MKTIVINVNILAVVADDVNPEDVTVELSNIKVTTVHSMIADRVTESIGTVDEYETTSVDVVEIHED